MWNRQQQPKSKIQKSELKSYLTENLSTPIYVVSTKNVITMKLVYDGKSYIGFNYIQADEKGEPPIVTIKPKNYHILLNKLTDQYLFYTVYGMKSVLDRLDSAPTSG